MTVCIGGDELGIELVGLAPLQLALPVAGNLRRVDDRQPITQLMEVLGERFVIDAGGLDHDPAVGLGVGLQPGCEDLETLGIVGQFAFGAMLAVGLQRGNVEAVLGDVDANNDGHKSSSSWNGSSLHPAQPCACELSRLWIPFGLRG